MQVMMQARLWRSYGPLFKGVQEPLALRVPQDEAIDEALPKPQNELAAEQPVADGSDDDYEGDDEPAPQPANFQPKRVSLQEISAGVDAIHDRQAAAHAAQNGALLEHGA